jgi:hypothetical protein
MIRRDRHPILDLRRLLRLAALNCPIATRLHQLYAAGRREAAATAAADTTTTTPTPTNKQQQQQKKKKHVT